MQAFHTVDPRLAAGSVKFHYLFYCLNLDFMGVCNKKSNDLPFFGIMSSTKIPKYQKGFHCSWTLYFIYLTTFNTNSELSAIFFLLSADIYHSDSGLLMIPTLRSIRNSKRMRFLSLQISVRTGLIRS